MTRASKYNDYAIFKIKLDGTENDYSKIHNIRNLYPKKRVIVDANESIAARDLGRYLEYAERFNIEMIEQPMKVEFDFLLKDIKAKTIICADESCHISNDIEKISQYYDAINIKLDKSGGLTEAMNMVKAAQKKDLKIMSGCMLCTSLGIAASQIIAYHADYIDHDGPLFLEKDRDHALSYHIDRVSIARSYLWG
jgi:L-alanine-DL-glutamate epimerase-like enolase superfamily enzyme